MPSIRTVLVQLDATAAAQPRLRTALALAARHGAALTGVFAAEPPAAAMATAVSEQPGELLLRADRAAYERAHAVFEAARADGTLALRWREPGPEGALADVLDEAAYADLLVLGAHDTHRPEGSPARLVDQVLPASGRPALVLPAGHALTSEAPVVLVGWDGSAAAVHALAAAQPWLEQARRVLVLDGSPPGDKAEPRIHAYLRRHGIDAEMLPWPHESDPPGQALQALARSEAVELLVMGCHGHGRLHELLLGSATCSLLHHAHLPLLMAH